MSFRGIWRTRSAGDREAREIVGWIEYFDAGCMRMIPVTAVQLAVGPEPVNGDEVELTVRRVSRVEDAA